MTLRNYQQMRLVITVGFAQLIVDATSGVRASSNVKIKLQGVRICNEGVEVLLFWKSGSVR